jgi:formylmethanofuran dehydrogenase subunit E-like metal-binding protein
MRMRLLEKSEIAKAKAVDRSKEISEGLKISKRVDSLRELAAREEQTLDMVRTRELERMATEFLAAQKKKEELLSEISELEERAKRELSKTDRQRLENLKKSLDKKEEDMKNQSRELDLKEVDIACSIKETNDSLARQKTAEEEAKRTLMAIENNRILAEQALLRAKNIEERSKKEKSDVEASISIRESAIVERERELSTKESENRELSREIAEERIRIADREATLERAIERLRKNRLA